MLIKMCGFQDPEHAFFAAEHGVHFVGMILTPGFRRSIALARAKEIAKAAREGGAEPVAVFVSETPQEVERICQEIEVSMVQFYPKDAQLSSHLRRFYVNEQEASLREGRDYLLIESAQPGCGIKLDPAICILPDRGDFFIAGGLNPENVQEMIQKYRPCGVDVSSGVEVEGKKECTRIVQFIQEVNRYE